MAPMTRFRMDEQGAPLANTAEYYGQRASVPGTFLVAEATFISARHAGAPYGPGIWTEEHIRAWKTVTDAVHAKKSFIFLQINAEGRARHRNNVRIYAPSAIPMDERALVPQEMTEDDIWATISDFKQAAINGMKAGFDGIEIHGANGYLIDQFTQDVSNRRTDAWGGSVERRSRFPLEVAKAVVEAVGSENVGMRMSPWGTYQGMKMGYDAAVEQYSHLLRGLKELRLAYIHLIESRTDDDQKPEGLEWAFDIWQNQSPILVAGGLRPETARKAIDEECKDHDAIAVFGRHFLANPDLVYRVKNGLELNQYDRSTFYTPLQSEGYTDYPFSKEYLESTAA